jgi:probable HAF family extracellular repeat protein
MRFISEVATSLVVAGVLIGTAVSAEIRGSYPLGLLAGDGLTMFDGSFLRYRPEEGWIGEPFPQRTIDDLPIEPLGISGDGATLVGAEGPSRTEGEAFRWTKAEGVVRLGSLIEGAHSFATAVSGDGSVVVGHSQDGRPYQWSAVRWTKEHGIQNLGTLDGPGRSFATAVSADGKVIAGMTTSARGIVPFRWTEEGGMVGLGGLPGEDFLAITHDISADGSTLIGETAKGHGGSPFRWTETEGMVEFVFEGTLPGSTQLNGLSGDGRLAVGQAMFENGDRHAVIWEQGRSPRLLKEYLAETYGLGSLPENWTLHSVKSVSDDGLTFSGAGLNPSGELVGWVLTVPEPPTAILAAAALATAGLFNLRRNPRR